MEAIEVTFHNAGLRSSIECNMCSRCPRDRVHGCCKISPVFLLTDIGFFLNNNSIGFLKSLLKSPYAEIGDNYLKVKAIKGVDGRRYCRFHHPEIGCRLPILYRNTVCRQFLCPEVSLWRDSRAKRWAAFWLRLQEEEIILNQALGRECQKNNCSLRFRQNACLELIKTLYRELSRNTSPLFNSYPVTEVLLLTPRLPVKSK
ncbi:MAG: hypothetical protein HPY58_01345 [Firmicutes bacterium]|nr:hypothetical protein [Bacillota bacterium]